MKFVLNAVNVTLLDKNKNKDMRLKFEKQFANIKYGHK